MKRLGRLQDIDTYGKSTSRTIGAMELGDEAQELENAVKELDVDMICKMHESVMASYSAVLDWCRVTTAQ